MVIILCATRDTVRDSIGRLPLEPASLCCSPQRKLDEGVSPMKYLHTMVRVTDLDAVAPLLPRPPRPQGAAAARQREGPLHPRLPRPSRSGGCAGRAHLQLGPGGLHRRSQLRPPRLRGRRHLRLLRQAPEGRRHHQPSAARRQHGLHPLARQHLGRDPAEGRPEGPAGAVGLDAEHRRLVAAQQGA